MRDFRVEDDIVPLLGKYRDKWREVPAGDDVDGRVFSDGLSTLSDHDFLATWERIADQRASGAMAWFGPLYRDFFAGKRVLEIGSGLGVDGIPMAALGARWTFADIVPGNLETIRRVARLKGIDAAFHVVDEDLSFESLTPGFDAILVIGSIHHVPYDITRREALNALQLLKVGGRWIELVYPRERWLREGAMSFDTWGQRTDGERTPWVEWYDMEKIRRRLHPARFRTVLDFDLRSRDQHWVDLEYLGMGRDSRQFVDIPGPIVLDAGERDGGTFTAPEGAFHPACHVELDGFLAQLSAPYEFEVIVDVQRGVIGVGLTDHDGNYLPDCELVVDSSPEVQTLAFRFSIRLKRLVFRNRHENCRSQFTVRRIRLREAA